MNNQYWKQLLVLLFGWKMAKMPITLRITTKLPWVEIFSHLLPNYLLSVTFCHLHFIPTVYPIKPHENPHCSPQYFHTPPLSLHMELSTWNDCSLLLLCWVEKSYLSFKPLFHSFNNNLLNKSYLSFNTQFRCQHYNYSELKQRSHRQTQGHFQRGLPCEVKFRPVHHELIRGLPT